MIHLRLSVLPALSDDLGCTPASTGSFITVYHLTLRPLIPFSHIHGHLMQVQTVVCADKASIIKIITFSTLKITEASELQVCQIVFYQETFQFANNQGIAHLSKKYTHAITENKYRCYF